MQATCETQNRKTTTPQHFQPCGWRGCRPARQNTQHPKQPEPTKNPHRAGERAGWRPRSPRRRATTTRYGGDTATGHNYSRHEKDRMPSGTTLHRRQRTAARREAEENKKQKRNDERGCQVRRNQHQGIKIGTPSAAKPAPRQRTTARNKQKERGRQVRRSQHQGTMHKRSSQR